MTVQMYRQIKFLVIEVVGITQTVKQLLTFVFAINNSVHTYMTVLFIFLKMLFGHPLKNSY